MTHLNKILVTGTSSGLGRFLVEELEAKEYRRGCVGYTENRYDVIIHNAWDTQRRDSKTYTYFHHANMLFNNLVTLPHTKFVFISSVEVYPKDDLKVYSADDKLDNRDIKGIYGLTKYSIEQQLQTHNNCLIIRPSAILGKYTRKDNNITKIRKGLPIRLHPASIINFVLYEDILKFIKIAIEEDLTGTYNLTSSSHVPVMDIHDGKYEVQTYLYTLPDIDNSKTQQILPELKRGSQETYQLWLKKS
tara:strand:+ start:6044 stop:6784 length:741 start_codon:yes stop_codon:yes gene_type:complete